MKETDRRVKWYSDHPRGLESSTLIQSSSFLRASSTSTFGFSFGIQRCPWTKRSLTFRPTSKAIRSSHRDAFWARLTANLGSTSILMCSQMNFLYRPHWRKCASSRSEEYDDALQPGQVAPRFIPFSPSCVTSVRCALSSCSVPKVPRRHSSHLNCGVVVELS